MPRLHLVPLILAASLAAQVPPGSYVATVGVGAAPATTGEMYLVDTASRKATQLTLPTELVTGVPNCVLMLTPVNGFVGTQGVNGTTPVPGDVFRITLAGTTVTASKLNTSPLGGYNVAQITLVGGNLWFTSADATTASASWGGLLYRMPLAGGTPTLVETLNARTDWPSATTTANALASDGKTVFIACWPGGEIYAHDVATSTSTRILTLPATKLNNTTAFYPVNAAMKYPAATSGLLAVCSLYGDVVTIDVAKKQVVSHWFHTSAVATGMSNSKNAFAENPDHGDWGIGTRDGALDVLVPAGNGHLGRRDVEGVGSSTTLTANSVNGLWYSRAAGDYQPFGPGCPGSGAFTPTSVGRGAGKQGNTAFGFGVDGTLGGTSVAVLILGASNTAPFPIDLTAAGAPGCFLRQDPLLMVPVATGGLANGLGSGTLPVPLPSVPLTLHTQWAVVDTAANRLGLAFSDSRTLKL
jgi:hypothetical protein